MGKIGELLQATSTPEFKYGHCSLTGDRLIMPIYACALGNVYNKYALKKHFSMRKKFPEMVEKKFQHLKGPLDVKQLNLTPNLNFNPKFDKPKSQFICPITKVEMDGKNKFVFLWTCGCVFSKDGIDTLSGTCSKCNKAYAFPDIVPLNPTDEEVKVLLERIHERRPLKTVSSRSLVARGSNIFRRSRLSIASTFSKLTEKFYKHFVGIIVITLITILLVCIMSALTLLEEKDN